ncbi:S-adenosyl-L-methionine-dependent methyltransferase [Haematococcus lacustris]
MRVASLFSGCGGLDLGLEQAGHQIIMQVESDPGAQQVLRRHFPGVLLIPDVCGLQSLPPDTELLAAGFPCVDVSRAGLRQGLAGDSSGLVRHVFRLLADSKAKHRPVPWVLLENVSGGKATRQVEALLDRCQGEEAAVQRIVDTLEFLGYSSWAQRVVCTAGFGIPNRRKRVFLVAAMYGDARDVLLSQGMQACLGACTRCIDPEGQPGSPCFECFDTEVSQDRQQPLELEQRSLAMDLGNARSAPGVDVVPTFTTNNSRMCLALADGQVGALRIEDMERLQGLPEGHTEVCWPIKAPGLAGHRGRGPSDKDAEQHLRARFALIGNAVTVDVARWLGLRLQQPYARKYYSSHKELFMAKEQQSRVLPPSNAELAEQRELQLALRGVLVYGAEGLVTQAAAPPPNQLLLPHPQGGGGLSTTTQADQGMTAAAGPGPGPGPGPEAAVGAGAGAGPGQGQGQGMWLGMGLEAGGEAGPGSGSGPRGEAGQGVGRGAGLGSGGGPESGSGGLSPPEPGHQALGPAGGQGPDRGGEQLVGQAPSSSAEAFLDDAMEVALGSAGQVGKPPDSQALAVYLLRLREQGWDIQPTLHKLRAANVSLSLEVTGVHRLQGSASDAERLGDLVWAREPGKGPGVWWPAQSLDPWNLPRDVTLSHSQRLLLKAREREMYLPSEPSAAQADETGPPKGRRKVLVIYFGDRQAVWLFRDELQDYESHSKKRQEELQARRPQACPPTP